MPAILSIPSSETSIVEVELAKEGLIIDANVIGLDRYGWRFRCSINDRNTLTIQRIDKNVGWYRSLHFRIYDRAVDNVPKFDTKLYHYHGLENEGAPFDVEEVFVDPSVKVIREAAFFHCEKMQRCIMGDHVKAIEKFAFNSCVAIKNIRLSIRLQSIGVRAFAGCISIRSIFIPSSVKIIHHMAFMNCIAMRILVLPPEICIRNVGHDLVRGCTALLTNDRVQYDGYIATNNDLVHHWIKHRYNCMPIIKLCADPEISAATIRAYYQENGSAPFSRVNDEMHGLTPLHILTGINSYASEDAIITCYDSNPEALCKPDAAGSSPLDNLLDKGNVDVIVHLIRDLCINRHLRP